MNQVDSRARAATIVIFPRRPARGCAPSRCTWTFITATTWARALPEAYERLLLDALQGDAALFARSDEIEVAWRLVDPLTAEAPPEFYTPGSWGPAAASALLAQARREWSTGCGSIHADE